MRTGTKESIKINITCTTKNAVNDDSAGNICESREKKHEPNEKCPK